MAGILQPYAKVAIVLHGIACNNAVVAEFHEAYAVIAVSSDDVIPDGISCCREETDSIAVIARIIACYKIVL